MHKTKTKSRQELNITKHNITKPKKENIYKTKTRIESNPEQNQYRTNNKSKIKTNKQINNKINN